MPRDLRQVEDGVFSRGIVTCQYFTQAFWIACRSLISCADSPAVLSVGVVERVEGGVDSGEVVTGGLPVVGVVDGVVVVGGRVVEEVLGSAVETLADEGVADVELTGPEPTGDDDMLDGGVEDEIGKAVPPGVRSSVLVPWAVLVDVQPVTRTVVITRPIPT